MYAEVFGIDVPLTQSQTTESTQGTHRTPSAPRRSTRLTSPALVPTVDKANEMILQDTLQVSLAEHKSREEQEARENVELVNKHLASEEIKKMADAPKMSDKESPEAEITNVVIPVNVNEEEEEITDEVYELKQREKGKIVKESRSTPSPTPIRSLRIHTEIEKLQELTKTDTTPTPSSSSLNIKAKFLSRKSFDTLADHLQEVMVESLPTMVDKHIKEQVKKQVPQVKKQVLSRFEIKFQYEQYQLYLSMKKDPQLQQQDIAIWLALQMKFESLQVPQTTCRTSVIRRQQQYQLYLSMKNDPQLQQQYIAIWLALRMKFESLQVPQTTCRTSVVRPRDHDDPHDDAHPEGENRAKRYPEAPPLSLINQDLLYLKKGSSGLEKIVVSLHKFPAIILNDDDIEE
ncbi:hypothetical protein Tco_0730088 [Tanacetum coccineum]|uniref:Uncharacterized protein n=1 Tax=Tanacetum coccineum TaxID=301880 RepID=A0ABQ4YRM0_9ASTR